MKISGHKKFKQIWMMEHWSCLHWSFMTISSQIYSDIRILRLKSCIAASVLIVCLSPRLISGSSIIHMLTMFGVYICSLVSPTSNKQKSKNTEDEYLRFLLNFFFCIFYILGIIDSVRINTVILVLLNTKTYFFEKQYPMVMHWKQN